MVFLLNDKREPPLWVDGDQWQGTHYVHRPLPRRFFPCVFFSKANEIAWQSLAMSHTFDALFGSEESLERRVSVIINNGDCLAAGYKLNTNFSVGYDAIRVAAHTRCRAQNLSAEKVYGWLMVCKVFFSGSLVSTISFPLQLSLAWTLRNFHMAWHGSREQHEKQL